MIAIATLSQTSKKLHLPFLKHKMTVIQSLDFCKQFGMSNFKQKRLTKSPYQKEIIE
jgi:hypothetical protein